MNANDAFEKKKQQQQTNKQTFTEKGCFQFSFQVSLVFLVSDSTK